MNANARKTRGRTHSPFALDARPPDGDPVALGDEIVRDDSDDAIVQR